MHHFTDIAELDSCDGFGVKMPYGAIPPPFFSDLN